MIVCTSIKYLCLRKFFCLLVNISGHTMFAKKVSVIKKIIHVSVSNYNIFMIIILLPSSCWMHFFMLNGIQIASVIMWEQLLFNWGTLHLSWSVSITFLLSFPTCASFQRWISWAILLSIIFVSLVSMCFSVCGQPKFKMCLRLFKFSQNSDCGAQFIKHFCTLHLCIECHLLYVVHVRHEYWFWF